MVTAWGIKFQLISDEILKLWRFPNSIMQIKKWYAAKLTTETQEMKRGKQSEEGGGLDDEVLPRALFLLFPDKQIIFP